MEHIDPVCDMTIDEKDAAGKSNYQGRDYYFCAPGCKTRFDEDPSRFVGGAQSPDQR